MRIAAALPLLLAACGHGEPAAGTNAVDIDVAAEQAQHSIDDYAARTARPPARRPVALAAIVDPPAPAPAPAAAPIATPSAAPLAPPAPGTPGGLPDDRTPISEAPFTPDSAQGAANVVQTYYALLAERRYRQARALWDHDGQDSGMTAAAFAASFAGYGEYHANVGAPGEIDAGMSQRWVTVPVQVYGRLRTGKPFAMLGTVQLHRVVAGVGAPAARQRWHIRSTDIKPHPAG